MGDYEYTFDDLVDILREQMEKNKTKKYKPDDKRMEAFELTYEAMKVVTKGSGAEVSYGFFEDFPDSGYVSVIGSQIVFADTRILCQAARVADNMEIYPRVDGRVQVNFVFNDLSREAGEQS